MAHHDQSKPNITWVEEESGMEKMKKKAKDSPFMILGIGGLLVACGIGAYQYRQKQMSTSLFLMQLRVAAQGTVAACLTAGVGYQILKEYWFTNDDTTIVKKK